ncbi:MAG: permease [Pelagibacterales bacterium MED-G42]|nr:MAG: permease [Pelagibacterales bacterium MED-G42]
MKKIIFRKLLMDCMTFFIIALVSASVIIWVFQAVNFLDIMIEDGRDFLVYIKFSLLNFPKIFSKLLPFVLFFSLFYITGRYEKNNELMIFWNFGVNKIQIINFFFKFSIILLLIQISLTAFVVPKSQELARSFLKESKVNFLGNFIKKQKFNDTIKGVTIFSERKDNEGNLYNLYLKKNIGVSNFQITYAKKGKFKEINNTPVLVLFDGETISKKDDEITNISFSKSDFILKSLESNTTTYAKTQEISSLNLLRCIGIIYKLDFIEKKTINKKIPNCSIQNITNIFKEFYKRLIIPLYIPILTLVPFMLIILSKENSNYLRLKILTFLIGLIVIIFSETTIRLISDTIIPNFKIIIIPFCLFLILYITFFYNFIYFKKNKI